MTEARPLTGTKVLLITVCAFAVIVAVNLTLAFKAVATFPGLEVKNSYVASQSFDVDRAAQEALGWQVSANVVDEELRLVIAKDDVALAPEIVSATFGRATHVGEDQTPAFTFDGTALVAPVTTGPGNWNLRLVARADDGTLFRQRVIVRVAR